MIRPYCVYYRGALAKRFLTGIKARKFAQSMVSEGLWDAALITIIVEVDYDK